jgi:peptidoglycan/LPS O-acetylase OafA/YrhL
MVDSPMWTVATEWQIYFFLPFVLLPIWRRFGALVVIVAAIGLGMLPVLVPGANENLETWCPWFLGPFAMGMTAAVIGVSSQLPARFERPGFWGAATLIVLSMILALETCLPRAWNEAGLWTQDCLNGAAVALLLVYLARSQLTAVKRAPMIARLLESRACVSLGAFSYSLYLIHLPVLDFVHVMLRGHLLATTLVLTMFLVAPPITLLFAYGFHLLFERPALLDYCLEKVRRLKVLRRDLNLGAHSRGCTPAASVR